MDEKQNNVPHNFLQIADKMVDLMESVDISPMLVYQGDTIFSNILKQLIFDHLVNEDSIRGGLKLIEPDLCHAFVEPGLHPLFPLSALRQM